MPARRVPIRSLAAAVLAGALASGCLSGFEAGDANGSGASDEHEPGLILRGGDFATRLDHLIELQVHEDHVYVANSNFGVAALSLDDNGGVTLTDVGTTYEDGLRCTSLALHASSDTLYCGSESPFVDPAPRIEAYDVSTPGQPIWRESFPVQHYATRDIEVVDEQLWIAHFDGGLWVAEIDEQGGLSELQQTPAKGNARVIAALDGRIAVLFGDVAGDGAELRLFDPDTLALVDRLPLRGPPLGMTADAEGRPRVAIGLGSGGMAVVSVDGDRLTLERTLEPPAVVTTGLLAGDLAVAVTLSGAFAYELDQTTPRMFGFGVSGRLGMARAGNMLHGLLLPQPDAPTGFELLTSDWLWVERWAIDRSGEVVDLDVPRGLFVPPEGPVRWRMRNPGEIPLHAEIWAGREKLWEVRVEPREVIDVRMSAELRAKLLPPDVPSIDLGVRVHDPQSRGDDPLSSTSLILAQREADDPVPPAVGESFPALMLEDIDHVPYSLPTPDGSQTIWYWPDCGLMWPELEDLAWLERSGWDLGRGEPILLTNFDVAVDGFPQRWGLEGVTFGMWGVAAPTVAHENDWLSEDDIYFSFFVYDLPGDAMPTDFVMGEDGIVRSIERMYRGPWTLVVPGPWE